MNEGFGQLAGAQRTNIDPTYLAKLQQAQAATMQQTGYAQQAAEAPRSAMAEAVVITDRHLTEIHAVNERLRGLLIRLRGPQPEPANGTASAPVEGDFHMRRLARSLEDQQRCIAQLHSFVGDLENLLG